VTLQKAYNNITSIHLFACYTGFYCFQSKCLGSQPWCHTIITYPTSVDWFLIVFKNISYTTSSGVMPLSRALIASFHWQCHMQHFYFASSHWPCHMHKQWHFSIYFLLFSFSLLWLQCQDHFHWLFFYTACHHIWSDCFRTPTASRAIPPHPEQHHFPSFYCFLVDCFLFFISYDIGCHLSLQRMPHRFSWLFSFFNCCPDATTSSGACHFLRRDATSSRAMPVLGAFIASWLIVFFPFFFLSLLPDATPLHAEWRNFIWGFYWFLVVVFFPFLSHLSLRPMPTPLWLIVFYCFRFPDDATSSRAFIGANAPLVDCFFL